MSRVEVLVPDDISGQVIPIPGSARFRRDVEARRARRRLYPVTVVYTIYCLLVLARSLASKRPVVGASSFLLGVTVWTFVEYLVHRHILHGRFADGPGVYQHFLHKYFDHLHWEHHKRPWDGNHINGTIKDTVVFALPVALLSFLAPIWSVPVFVAGILQAYVVEEWVHYSVHFYQSDNRYFRYIKRHHLYHHSPKGMDIAFGLTSGLWDVVYDTRIHPSIRRALHERHRPLKNSGA